jgi:hypothetical protein
MKNINDLRTTGKSSRNIQSKRTKGFGYQVLGFGSGGKGASYIVACGGTSTTSGNYKIHTFTGPGTFTVCSLASCAANDVVSYVVVAGGGGNYGGPGIGSGGGGAGGFREGKDSADSYAASPLAACGGAPVSVTSYPIAIGAAGGTVDGTDSSALCITSTGGGAGRTRPTGGNPGGSGGGAGDFSGAAGGAGNTPPVSPSQGFPGFAGSPGEAAGGGGGATTGGPAPTQGASPGLGAATSITGSSLTYAAGGDGEGPGNSNASAPIRSAGGHGMGAGGTFPGSPTPNASAQAGVVIVRYKYK